MRQATQNILIQAADAKLEQVDGPLGSYVGCAFSEWSREFATKRHLELYEESDTLMHIDAVRAELRALGFSW